MAEKICEHRRAEIKCETLCVFVTGIRWLLDSFKVHNFIQLRADPAVEGMLTKQLQKHDEKITRKDFLRERKLGPLSYYLRSIRIRYSSGREDQCVELGN